ncbi:MAG: translational GTPase TypA [Phycisphaerales bacterium]
MTSTHANHLRNVAIIAHVDHGKTTLVDAMLTHTGTFDAQADACVLDSNPIERERGITIFSKNCAIEYTAEDGHTYRLNLIDTPGHADFGGEVERVLRMADGALLLVDAFEGPMPQTRFVLSKALELGLRIIVVINKCDRSDARPHAVIGDVFDLLDSMGADDHTLDFPVIYASGRDRWAGYEPGEHDGTVIPLLETIVKQVPPPRAADRDAPLQMLITTLDYSSYVGRIAIGRIYGGTLKRGMPVVICGEDNARTRGRVLQVYQFVGLGRRSVEEVYAGDLCAVEGIDGFDIGDTVCLPEQPLPMTRVTVDEPTLHMLFRVNDSPFAGREGKYVTSRQIAERLERELQSNVALRVEPAETADAFRVSGRGLLHLGVLLENMRREGFELAVGRPEVIEKVIDGVRCEPIEVLTVDVVLESVGAAMELLGQRNAEILHMTPRQDRMHLELEIPARSLIGLRSRLLTATGGDVVMHHSFKCYAPARTAPRRRRSGVMIATETGVATFYALYNLVERGVMFVTPQQPVYGGQIVGENSREGDLGVNVVKAKAFSNVRESNKEATVTLKAPRIMGLEPALEYIEDDELVEITPESIRLRKRFLLESDRRRAERGARIEVG